MSGGAIAADAPCIDCGGKRTNKKWRCDECSYRERYEHMRDGVTKIRQETFVAYGGKCVCCGETEQAFLVIDHVDGGGNEHRKSLNGGNTPNGGGGTRTYRWLKKNGWPAGFQLLCANCNTAKDRPGGCPHQRGETIV